VYTVLPGTGTCTRIVLVGVVVQSAVPFLLFQEVSFNEFQAAYSKVRTTGPA
jgi:hypothetical protein